MEQRRLIQCNIDGTGDTHYPRCEIVKLSEAVARNFYAVVRLLTTVAGVSMLDLCVVHQSLKY